MSRCWTFLRGDGAQALTEQALLLALLLGVAVSGGAWLVRRHPEMLHAIDVAVGSYSFVLSLPIP